MYWSINYMKSPFATPKYVISWIFLSCPQPIIEHKYSIWPVTKNNVVINTRLLFIDLSKSEIERVSRHAPYEIVDSPLSKKRDRVMRCVLVFSFCIAFGVLQP